MPSFELSKLQGVSAARGLAETDRTQLDGGRRAAASTGEPAPAKPGVAIEVSASIDASQPPVDADRVSEIRKALEDSTYPLVPTTVADAMIAARVGFGVNGE
ncbi:MAG: flagellar biosynthesis anti-sigma factor FlgM [Erythrobacter sp.]|uniref:flagellar biosynthesis anti-sigma factor FlgM n=1 Tax=Erythrobacter sp. TaxID=1042 RepID=UPI00260257BA|nr:flagellar biosynthesis anti-sigma factor FlgM [Erythrobacter sp.]MDJ0979164.1 flagellar biosynthesis anti-sigma factor FlgM [Erythrobacter sp.]